MSGLLATEIFKSVEGCKHKLCTAEDNSYPEIRIEHQHYYHCAENYGTYEENVLYVKHLTLYLFFPRQMSCEKIMCKRIHNIAEQGCISCGVVAENRNKQLVESYIESRTHTGCHHNVLRLVVVRFHITEYGIKEHHKHRCGNRGNDPLCIRIILACNNRDKLRT